MSTGNLLGGAAGGVAGYFAAGPLGISVGAGIIGGAIIGSLLGGLSSGQKMVMEYGKLSSRNWQGSEYGGDIPRGYGTFPATGSQIVWMEHNKLKEVVKKKKSGGKGGGGGTTTKTYTYFATFALMLCQGEVAGVRRIWCGDKLIYNAGSDDLETIIASNQAAKGWKLYRGTDDQLPDPRYEADVGVGNAPAFRGYTYIAFYDFALADYSNTLQAAQFKVELVREASYSLQQKAVDFVPIFSQLEATISAIGGGAKKFIGVSSSQPWYLSAAYRRVTAYFGNTVTDASLAGSGYLACMSWQSGISQPFYQNAYSNVVVSGSRNWSIGAVTNLFPLQTDGDHLYCYNASGVYHAQYSADGTVPTQSVSLAGIGAIKLHNGELLVFRNGEVRRYSTMDLSLISVVSSPVISTSYLRVAGEDGNIYLSNSDSLTTISRLSDDFQSITASYVLSAVPGIASGIMFNVVDGVIHRAAPHSTQTAFYYDAYVLNDLQPSSEYLTNVLLKECELSSLISTGDLDVSLISQTISGYRVSGGTIRSVIEPLQGAYPFDVVPSGYKIKFVPRGQSPVVTIPWEDLAAANGEDIGDSLPYSREMDSQLPQKVTITALSSTREYGAATQSYERMNTSAVNVEQRDIPLVLSDDEIAQMAEKLLFLRWLERDDYNGPTLPPTYQALEPSDVVLVKAKFGDIELRLTEVNYEADGRLTCKAKANSAPLYTSRAVGAEVPGPSGNIPLPGPSLFIPMDIPVVDETLQNDPGFVGAMTGYTDGWPGAVAVRSADDGQTWTDLQGFVGKATLGTTRDSLSVNNCTVIDQRTLTVDLISGELESVTRDQMLSGVNYAAYGSDGRWEIVRFQNATLQADGSYILSGFVRGDRGTEWATGLHQIGDYFVLLDDPDNAFIGMAVGSIGVPATYRGVTSGDSIDNAIDVPFTYKGVNLECLSPVSARGSRDASSNFTGTFTRRTRLSSSWWTNGIAGPVGEASEAYEIDVMSGSTVKRTISVSSPTWTYSAANQTTDFGSAQAAITFRIFQISATVGRGYPREVTL